jgi:hypothetical protein
MEVGCVAYVLEENAASIFCAEYPISIKLQALPHG